MASSRTKKCPYCAEEIKYEAIKCRYCGEFLTPAKGGSVPGSSRSAPAEKEPLLFDLGQPIPLTCAACGGDLEITDDSELFECEYCKKIVLIRRRVQAVTEPSSPKPVKKVAARTEKIEPIMEGAANYWVNSLMYHTGKVLLTETDVIFVPDKFNFVKAYRVVLPISEISRVWKSGTVWRYLNIQTEDGKVTKFIMWGRDPFIREIQARMG